MAKRWKSKMPKRIAGVRIPKGMRRALRPIAEAVDTPLGRQVVAGAVIATAVAIWRDERVRMAAARVRDDIRSWLSRVSDQSVEISEAAVTPRPSRPVGADPDAEPTGRRAH